MIDDADDTISNTSGNRPFEDIALARLQRRRVLQGGLLGAAAFMIKGSPVGAITGESTASSTSVSSTASSSEGLLTFDAIPTNSADTVTVPSGYRAQPIVPWGEPIVPGGPAFKHDASNTSDEQAEQLGMGHDGIQYFPLGDNRDSSVLGILAINHEYTTNNLLFPDGAADWTHEKTVKEQNAHGMSMVSVERDADGNWNLTDTGHARRVTPNTPTEFTGRAAGDPLLRTAADPTGMYPTGIINQCGNGITPWGTVLTTEENFNGYFWEETEGTAEGISEKQAALNERYGVAGQGFGYQWASTDEQWRADLHPNRPNTHGWIVEIDPYDPASTPKKHTALGRFKHEAAVVAESERARAVIYMGDDQRFDYVYKFVSDRPWRDAVKNGHSPLERGTLLVARFDEGGTGRWLPLLFGAPGLTRAEGFESQGDVLVRARQAADSVGATPMDRPEWIETLPGGHVYVACTNNTRREEPNAANPRADNVFGHIVRISENGEAFGSWRFTWDHFVLAGAGDGSDGSTLEAEDMFGSPDGLFADVDGRLWIQTDGSQPDGSNNQMLAADPSTGEIRRFLVGPVDCEVTGACKTPDGTTMFIDIQHPGDGGTAEDPTATSAWPSGDLNSRPRPATVAITRLDGGVVG